MANNEDAIDLMNEVTMLKIDRDEWRDAAKALSPRLDAAEGEAYRLGLECDRLKAALEKIARSPMQFGDIAREALKERT